MAEELLVTGPTATMCQVSLDGCYRGGNKQYYLDTAAPERANVVGYECIIPQGRRATETGCEPLDVRNDLKMEDELLVAWANGNHVLGQS